jgi:AcrR family transcriptional regulator
MDKKQKIIKTALKLIVDQGLQETPMSQVSKVSGVAMGTIYHHFKSKNEIVNAIYLYLKEEMGNALMLEPSDTDDYKTKFFEFWSNLYMFYIQNEEAFKYLQAFVQSPLISSETKEKGRQYYMPIVEFFKQGIDDEILKPLNIVVLTEIIHGNVVTLVQIYFQNSIEINKTIIDQTIQLSWDSVINKN